MRSSLLKNAHSLARRSTGVRARTQRLSATCSNAGKYNEAHGAPRLPQLLRGWSRGSRQNGSTRKPSGRGMSGGIGASGGGGGAGRAVGTGGNGGSSGGSPWGLYMRWLESNPILTKSVTAAILNAIGDIISQKYFEKNDKLSFRRIFQFALLGLVLVGPALHFWYGTLATRVTIPGIPGLLTRLFCDQALFAPVFISIFFSALLVLEGHPELINNKLKQDLKGALYANWQLWIPVQLLNFAYIPVNLQVLFSNTIAIGWNTFMSYKAHKKVPPAEVEL